MKGGGKEEETGRAGGGFFRKIDARRRTRASLKANGVVHGLGYIKVCALLNECICRALRGHSCRVIPVA